MNVNVRQIFGPWSLGYSLDQHTVRSTYTGDNASGRPTFDTVRTEAGEALFQLKYRANYSNAAILGEQMSCSLRHYFLNASFVIPMPPSKPRPLQPVAVIAREVAMRMGLPCVENFLLKNTETPQVKDMGLKNDRAAALSSAFRIDDVMPGGNYDVLLIDDVYDTGSSLAAATRVILQCPKIRQVFVAAVTRKKP